MRALVITNMYPSAEDAGHGSFVRDQVKALRRLGGVEVELFAFPRRGPAAYPLAARELRRRYSKSSFDIIHSHFGLMLWPSLALRGAPHVVTLHGTDLVHPRSRAITVAGLPMMDLVAPVSPALAKLVPSWAVRGHLEVLPMGVDIRRFHPIDRVEARRKLGLDEAGPYVLFPADPARPEKRFDRARAVSGRATLLTLGNVEPEVVPLWVNAANAVLVPSERESFGLAVLEALACQVPVLATPVGVAPEALNGVDGCLCEPFDANRWRAFLDPLLGDPDPRIEGRARAEAYSVDRCAQRMLAAWQNLLR